MANENDLAIAVEANLKDFNRAMGQIESRIRGMEKKVGGEMRGIEQKSRKAARTMETEFAQATTGIGNKMRALKSFSADPRGLLGGAFGALSAAGAGTGVFGVVGGVAGGAALQGIIAKTDAISDLRAEAERAGLSFQDFQSLKFAFGQERVNIDALTDGFKELQLRADEFITTGKGPSEEAFRRIGYTAGSLAKALKDPKELLFDILSRLRDVDKAAQIRITDELLGGTGGEQFMQLLDAHPEALRQAALWAERNVNLTDEIGEKAERVSRRFGAMGAVIESAVGSALTNAGEKVISLIDKMSDLAEAARDFSEGTTGGSATSRLDEIEQDIGLFETQATELKRARESYRSALFGQDVDLGIPEGYLDTVTKTTGEFDEQEAVIQRIQEMLKRVDELAALAEADGAKERLEALRSISEKLKQELFSAGAALVKMGGDAAAVMEQLSQFSANPFLPGAGPQGTSTPTGISTAEGRALVRPGVDAGGLRADVRRDALEIAREFGLTISSGYRDAQRNAAVGGATHSRHLERDAVDLSGVTRQNVAAIVYALQGLGFRGFGYYNNGSLHADKGPARAWGPNYRGNSLSQTPIEFQQAVAIGPSMANVPATQRLQWSEEEFKAQQKLEKEAAAEAKKTAEERQKAQERQSEAIADVNRKMQEGIEFAQLENEMLREGKYTRDEISNAIDAEREARQRIQELKAAGVEVDAAEEERIRREIALKYQLVGVNEKLKDANAEQVDKIKDLKAAFEQFGDQAIDSFFAILEGSQTAEDAIKGLIKQLAKMLLQGALMGTGPLGKIFGGGLFGGLFSGGGPVEAAGGGYITGPGGPKSDMVAARLSNGEYVINAEATRRNRRLLDAINSGGGLPGFAAGGIVSPSSAARSLPMPSVTGGGVTLHLQQNMSLDGANGDDAIRRIARDYSKRGVAEAVSQVQASLLPMARVSRRNQG